MPLLKCLAVPCIQFLGSTSCHNKAVLSYKTTRRKESDATTTPTSSFTVRVPMVRLLNAKRLFERFCHNAVPKSIQAPRETDPSSYTTVLQQRSHNERIARKKYSAHQSWLSIASEEHYKGIRTPCSFYSVEISFRPSSDIVICENPP